MSPGPQFQNRVQVAHIVHHIISGTFHAGLLQPEFEHPQVGQGHDAGKKMAADLAVGPVPKRLYVDQIIVFALPEAVLYLPPVQVSLDDLGRGPVGVVGDDDALAQ